MPQHTKTHPLIVLYEETENKDFPLILIIGREPNNKVPFEDVVGKYDFKKSPHCAFWNMAYKLIGESNNLSTKRLKEICNMKRSSIICFTDSLPITIISKERNKKQIRRSLDSQIVKEHIDKIFSKRIIKRVKLILLSGLNHKEFENSVRRIKEYCFKNSIEYYEIPFLYPSNYKNITLDNNKKDLIRKIFNNWIIT